MTIVWVLDVKDVAYELYGSFAKVGARRQTKTAAVLKSFTKTFLSLKNLIEIYYIVSYINAH